MNDEPKEGGRRPYEVIQGKGSLEDEYIAMGTYQRLRTGLESRLMESIDAAEAHTETPYIRVQLSTDLIPREHVSPVGSLPLDCDEFEIIVHIPTKLEDLDFEDFDFPHDDVNVEVYQETRIKRADKSKAKSEKYQYVAITPLNTPITHVRDFNEIIPRIIETANQVYAYVKQKGLTQMYGEDGTVTHLLGGKSE